MYLLYIDGSGSVKNPNEEYFILGGVSVFERQIFHLIKRMDEFVESLDFGFSENEDIELHASTIASGREKPWKGNVQKARRFQIIEDALEIVRESHRSVNLFAVHKERCAPYDPVEYAFEEICNRFNLQLQRIYHRAGKKEEGKHRGLVVMDKSNYENALQSLARTFRVQGTRWGELRNMAEVPLFVDSQASRIIQIADLVAWAVWRRYEFQDTRYFDKIVSRFDSEGGVLHGLVHFGPKDENCHCPACLTRAVRDAAGQ